MQELCQPAFQFFNPLFEALDDGDDNTPEAVVVQREFVVEFKDCPRHNLLDFLCDKTAAVLTVQS